jgi:hypothetical protein
MMRTNSALMINHIANHPSVKPSIMMAGHDPENTAPLDFSELETRPDHYLMFHNGSWNLDPDANFALVFDGIRQSGCWEQHSLSLPSCRGRKGLKAAKEMHRHMFEEEGALILWGQTPVSNRAACLFNRWCGGSSMGFGDHYNFGAVEFFRLTRDEWETNQAK